MFGGQDNSAALPQTAGTSTSQDDTLKGVADLVGASASVPPAAAPVQDTSQGGTFLPRPADAPQADAPTLPADNSSATASTSTAAGSDELLGLKQQALQQLTPLVSHLEQTPVEKFRTTMMLIQASDNQALLKEAYEAAQKIEDDKVRAQALLDVINEINYFTQSKDQ